MNYPNADPNYRSEKLKKRLKNHFTDEVVFIPSKNPTKSDYIMSSSVTIRDAVHSAAKLKEDITKHSLKPVPESFIIIAVLEGFCIMLPRF